MPSTGVVEHVPDRPDVLGAADERGKDHIHALRDAKLEVGDILLGHGRELGDDAWHVDPLLLTEVGVVLDNGDNIGAITVVLLKRATPQGTRNTDIERNENR